MKFPFEQVIWFHGFPVSFCDPVWFPLWTMTNTDLNHDPVHGSLARDMYPPEAVSAAMPDTYGFSHKYRYIHPH